MASGVILQITRRDCVFEFFGTIYFSSRRRHTSYIGDWSSDVCSSDRATRAGVALVARRPLVDRLELGLAPHEREDVIHAERLAKTVVDRPDELEARQPVDRPATVGEVRLVCDIEEAEQLRVFPDVGRDVFTLGDEPRLVPSPFECGEREHFGIQTVGERRRLRVADVVEHAAGLEELREDPARDSGVEQRTVGSDPHDNGNAEPARRPVEAVQDVLLVTRIGRQIVIGGESKDRVVRRLLGRRDDDSLDPGDPPRALHEAREHGLPGDVGEGLAGQSRRAHPRLHDGSDHRPTGTGRPCAAAAFAASATSRIARPPAASSIGESPVSTHRPKWRISSTNIWLRSVLIDSWKTSMRRSSLPYTVTDWLM